MRLLFLIIKLIIVVAGVWFILQFEYNGRRLQTYVVEYFKSYGSHEKIEKPKTAPMADTKEKSKNGSSDGVSDKDRKELQDILEK